VVVGPPLGSRLPTEAETLQIAYSATQDVRTKPTSRPSQNQSFEKFTRNKLCGFHHNYFPLSCECTSLSCILTVLGAKLLFQLSKFSDHRGDHVISAKRRGTTPGGRLRAYLVATQHAPHCTAASCKQAETSLSHLEEAGGRHSATNTRTKYH
jgi:hypothetical protein